MIKIHATIEQEESIRIDGIECAEYRPRVTRVLRRYNRGGVLQWLQFLELCLILANNRKDSLRVIRIS